MELIAHQELTSAASSITFSAIPQTYTDLYLVVSARLSNTEFGYEIIIAPNGSTANGSSRVLRGYNGNQVQSYTESYVFAQAQNLGNGATSNTFGNAAVYISNYTSSNNKTFTADAVSENNASDGRMEIVSSVWSNTAAITSLQLVQRFSFQFLAGSSATLYGINRTSAIGRSPQAMGGYINYANGYWYHTFTGSGSFVPFNNMQVEYVVVAGGGGGSRGFINTSGGGGGGGAGGYRSSVAGEISGGGAGPEAALTLTAGTNYSVVVGAGGAGNTTTADRGTQGSSSSFWTVSTTGGGGGGNQSRQGGDGGSSGGSGWATAGISTGAPVAGQGFSGGITTSSGSGFAGAGGGGAGSAGQAVGDSNNGGTGGSGVATYVSGSLTYLAGGGGGGGAGTVGSGGLGGGAAGNGSAGTENTGGGGGGNYGTSNGGAGGSGVVIVRYKG